MPIDTLHSFVNLTVRHILPVPKIGAILLLGGNRTIYHIYKLKYRYVGHRYVLCIDVRSRSLHIRPHQDSE